jgi:hypothetical protein
MSRRRRTYLEGGFQEGNNNALMESLERQQVLALIEDGLGGLFLSALLHLHGQLLLPTLPPVSCCRPK